MIVSYMTRLLLMLPDLTNADVNALADIANHTAPAAQDSFANCFPINETLRKDLIQVNAEEIHNREHIGKVLESV